MKTETQQMKIGTNTARDYRTRMMTTPSPSATHMNRAHRFQLMSHSMPGNNTYGGNSHLTNHLEGQPGQGIGFITPIHVKISCLKPYCLATWKHHYMPGEQFMRAFAIIHYDRTNHNTGSINIHRNI